MVVTVTFDKVSARMDELVTIDVLDTGIPTRAIVEAEIQTISHGPVRKTFPLDSLGAGAFRTRVHGWRFGAFTPQTMPVFVYTDTPDHLATTKPMEITEGQDPFQPILQWFITLLQTDPVLSTFTQTFKLVRKPHQSRSETPAFYVYMERATMEGMVGSNLPKYINTVTVVYLEEMTTKRDADQNKHMTFIKRVTEAVFANPQLDPSLGVVTATPRRGNIPFNAFEYVFGIASKVEIDVEVIPNYP